MAEHSEHVNCQAVVEMVTDHLEGALGGEDAALLEQHLNFCDGCVAYVDQIRMTVRTVGLLREPEVPEETCAALLAAFRGWRAS